MTSILPHSTSTPDTSRAPIATGRHRAVRGRRAWRLSMLVVSPMLALTCFSLFLAGVLPIGR